MAFRSPYATTVPCKEPPRYRPPTNVVHGGSWSMHSNFKQALTDVMILDANKVPPAPGRIPGTEKPAREWYVPFKDDLQHDPSHRPSPLSPLSMSATEWHRTAGSRSGSGVIAFDGYWEQRDHWRNPDPAKRSSHSSSSSRGSQSGKLARCKSVPSDSNIFRRSIESFRTMPLV